MDKHHYCDRDQITKLGSDISYGTSCYYRSINWKVDTVEDVCTYQYHQGVVRISKRKIKFRKFKIFFYHLINLRLGIWFFTVFSDQGPIEDCQCLPYCYKLGKKSLRKAKLKKLQTIF